MPPRKTRLFSAVVLFGAAMTGCRTQLLEVGQDAATVRDAATAPDGAMALADAGTPLDLSCPPGEFPSPCGEMNQRICCYPLIL